MRAFWQDLRFAARSLARRPGYAALSFVTLALGLGLTILMFAAVNAYVLRPLPIAEPEKLLRVELTDVKRGGGRLGLQIHDFLDVREQQTSLLPIAAFYTGTINVAGMEFPERFDGAFTTASTFELLGFHPTLGRIFTAGDEAPDAAPVVMLSHEVWQQRFGGAPNTIGRTLRVNGRPATVIGVMPQGFRFPANELIWMPLSLDVSGVKRGEGHTVAVIGRLKDGKRLADVQGELAGIWAELARLYPDTNEGLSPVVQPFADRYVDRGARTAVKTMFGAVLLVLLIACANVAHLVFARTVAGARDLAIRATLGASRWRLITHVLSECLLVAVTAAVAGYFVASLAGDVLFAAIRASGDPPPFWVDMRPDWRNVLFASVAALLATLLGGLLPAWRVAAPDTMSFLRGTGTSQHRTPLGRFSRALVVGEIALACIVLVSAGLMTRSALLVLGRDVGARTDGFLCGRIGLFPQDYPRPADRARFFTSLAERLGTLPGVAVATVSTSLPATGVGGVYYEVEGVATASDRRPPTTGWAAVDPGFFQAFEVPVLEGRSLSASDTADAARVAVVSRLLAERLAATGTVLGRRLRMGGTADLGSAPWCTVVGVVSNVLQDGVDDDLAPMAYVPIVQDPPRFASVAVRVNGDPLAFAEVLRREVARLDPNLPVYWVRSLEQWIAIGAFYPRLMAALFSSFAVIGLILAAGGLFAVLAHDAARRVPEIGVRLALGSTQGGVVRLLVGQATTQLAIGLAIGVAGAAGFAQLLSSLLFTVKPLDPLTFSTVIVAVVLVAAAAAIIPALRALRVAPAQALRYE